MCFAGNTVLICCINVASLEDYVGTVVFCIWLICTMPRYRVNNDDRRRISRDTLLMFLLSDRNAVEILSVLNRSPMFTQKNGSWVKTKRWKQKDLIQFTIKVLMIWKIKVLKPTWLACFFWDRVRKFSPNQITISQNQLNFFVSKTIVSEQTVMTFFKRPKEKGATGANNVN